MRKTLLFAAIAVFTMLMVSCKASRPEQTIANLKTAITGESNASAKYAAFSKRAAEDSLMNIAKLFAAASTAEAIHANNHMAVLNKLGDSMEVVIENFAVDSTLANLNTALMGENYEISEMYPPMIVVATADKSTDAVNTFSWAMDVEKSHVKIYEDAIAILTTDGSDANISATWYVCPACGQTVSSLQGFEECTICGAPASSFRTI